MTSWPSTYNDVEAALQSLPNCHFEKYEEEILTGNRTNLRIRIRFVRGIY